MDWPATHAQPLFLNTWSRWSGTFEMRANVAIGTPAAITPSASLAYFTPMSIPWPYPVRRVCWLNGSTTTSTTVAFGIYTMDGRNVYSTGNTVQGTASTMQFVTPSTPFVLSPGTYLFGFGHWGSTMTSRGYGTNAASFAAKRAGGFVQVTGMASTATFPSSVAFAQVTDALIPLVGVTRTVTGWL